MKEGGRDREGKKKGRRGKGKGLAMAYALLAPVGRCVLWPQLSLSGPTLRVVGSFGTAWLHGRPFLGTRRFLGLIPEGLAVVGEKSRPGQVSCYSSHGLVHTRQVQALGQMHAHQPRRPEP